MKVGILTPAYSPAPGGAANYARVLATHLAMDPAIKSVSVFSEKYPGELDEFFSVDGKLAVYRLFPHRASRNVKDWRSYLRYAEQNLSFRKIDKWLPGDLDVLLVHAHFHYNPNLLYKGLETLSRKRARRPKLVLDVRDPLLPQHRKGCAHVYDRIICCSENCVSHIRDNLDIAKPIDLIPVPIEKVWVSPDEIEETCKFYNLLGKRYFFSTNGIMLSKGVETCIRITELFRDQGEDVVLAVAGRRKDWGPRVEDACKKGILKFLGPISQREVLALAARSLMHLNPSSIEGLPRASLEAMTMGAPVLLPTNVPEFQQYVPNLVAQSMDPEDLTRQIVGILQTPAETALYPISRHYVENVIPKYVSMFSKDAPGGC